MVKCNKREKENKLCMKTKATQTELSQETGLFLSFEGLDGVGKTTQIKKVVDFLQKKGYEVLLFREPGGTLLGEDIRSLLFHPQKKPQNKWSELFLFLASRAELWEQKIKPALLQGKIVICDRFMDSTVAYQAYGRDLPSDLLVHLHTLFLENHLPLRTYWLDMDLEKIEERKASRKESNHFDLAVRAFKEKVVQGYHYLYQKDRKRILRVNADQSFWKVHQDICADLQKLLVKRKLKRKFSNFSPESQNKYPHKKNAFSRPNKNNKRKDFSV